MKTWRQYKNHSRQAKIIAWGIDLTIGSLFKIGAACGRAIRGTAPVSPHGPSPAGKILLIRLDHIGDLLMTTPAIHALKQSFPQSTLSMLVSPASLPVIAANPEIDAAFTFKVPWYDGGRAQRFPFRAYLRLIRQLRRERFDAVIDFRGDVRILWLFSFFSRARERVGFSGLGGEFLLTRSCPYDEARHFAAMSLALVNCLAGRPAPADSRCFMPTSAGDAADVDRILAGLGLYANDRIVGIHPTAIPHWRLKRWPPERFAALADALARLEGAKIIFTGGMDDAPELQRITAAMKESAYVLAGKTSIPQLAALIKRCRLYISNDTGPMHIAAAVRTPLVAIFGPTDPGRSGPCGDPESVRVISRDMPCRKPCFVQTCPIQHECMNGISLDSVLQACRDLLRLGPGPREHKR